MKNVMLFMLFALVPAALYADSDILSNPSLESILKPSLEQSIKNSVIEEIKYQNQNPFNLTIPNVSFLEYNFEWETTKRIKGNHIMNYYKNIKGKSDDENIRMVYEFYVEQFPLKKIMGAKKKYDPMYMVKKLEKEYGFKVPVDGKIYYQAVQGDEAIISGSTAWNSFNGDELYHEFIVSRIVKTENFVNVYSVVYATKETDVKDYSQNKSSAIFYRFINDNGKKWVDTLASMELPEVITNVDYINKL